MGKKHDTRLFRIIFYVLKWQHATTKVIVEQHMNSSRKNFANKATEIRMDFIWFSYDLLSGAETVKNVEVICGLCFRW